MDKKRNSHGKSQKPVAALLEVNQMPETHGEKESGETK